MMPLFFCGYLWHLWLIATLLPLHNTPHAMPNDTTRKADALREAVDRLEAAGYVLTAMPRHLGDVLDEKEGLAGIRFTVDLETACPALSGSARTR